jgi:hypothetical protein
MKKTPFITFFKTLFRVIEFYLFEFFAKKRTLKQFYESSLYKKISKGVVLDGPFKGMRYPTNQSFGSAFYPKILGTYEKELELLISNLLVDKYDLVIDVGCAEGYYAVGFAKFSKAQKVFAYDIEEKARELCSEMVKINNVSDKVVVSNFFDFEEYQKILNEFPKSRILIILDIEGYEKIILDTKFKNIIINTDFLIEMHDYLDLEITESVNSFFEGKKITKIFSLSDFQKAIEYNSELLQNLDFKTKYYLLSEGRPEQMKWYLVRN